MINSKIDIDNLQMLCNLNRLFSNINKCTLMHYYQTQNPINLQYYILDLKIEFVSNVNNLEIIFDTKLNVLFI